MMKSFQLHECKKPFVWVEKETPTPTGTQVLLKVLAAGVCHSDIHFRDGTYELGGGEQLKIMERGVKLPLTLGHENCGEVVAVGPEVRELKVGSRGLAWSWIGCSQCPSCKADQEQLCPAPKYLGAFADGGYSSHLLLPHPRYLLGIGKMSPEAAAPLACAGITAFGALKKVDPEILRSQPIVIMSAGGLGLMGLALHKALAGKGAIVVEPDAGKRDAAKKAGAMAVIDANAADAAEQIKKLTDGGAAAVVDYVGLEKTFKLALDCLKFKGGHLVIVGLFGGKLVMPLPFIPMRALKIEGSYLGSRKEMGELLDLLERTNTVLPVPVSKRPLGEADCALDDLERGKVVGRLVLVPAE